MVALSALKATMGHHGKYNIYILHSVNKSYCFSHWLEVGDCNRFNDFLSNFRETSLHGMAWLRKNAAATCNAKDVWLLASGGMSMLFV